MTEAGQARSLNERDHPRNLPNADSKAVTPISPAAQKFHLFILCSALDRSVIVSSSSVAALALGKRHIADANQKTAEPQAVIMTAVSLKDLIITPSGSHDGSELFRSHQMRPPAGSNPGHNPTYTDTSSM